MRQCGQLRWILSALAHEVRRELDLEHTRDPEHTLDLDFAAAPLEAADATAIDRAIAGTLSLISRETAL